jgi:hypothetical protein
VKNYLLTNAKLKRDGIFKWGIPAYRAASGFITCPMAKDCIKGCYAKQGFYVMPSTAKAQEERLALSKSAAFVATIDAELKRRSKVIKVLRIHDSGDFYSKAYAMAWFEIAWNNPSVKFYAYTKMVPLFKIMLREKIPANLTLIYSYGGKADSDINAATDRHSAVFSDRRAMINAGYADTTTHDKNAYGSNHRVGLVYHGAKSRAWEAGAA